MTSTQGPLPAPPYQFPDPGLWGTLRHPEAEKDARGLMEGRQGRAKPALREAPLAADKVKGQDENSAFPGIPTASPELELIFCSSGSTSSLGAPITPHLEEGLV